MTIEDNTKVVTGFAGAAQTAATTTTPAKTTTTTTTAAKGAGADAMAALRAQLGATAAGYHFHKGDHMFADYAQKPVNYVTAKNGIFRVTAKPIGIFASRVGAAPTANMIPGLADLKEGVTLTIPKIKFDYWLQILSFYRDVHKKDGTEASVLFFWNHNNLEIPRAYESVNGQPGREIKGIFEDGQLIIICPEQVNSGTLSNFTKDGMVTWLRANTTGLCETHSHHTMGAFWSGTDDQNENMTQFYGVYGTIFQSTPAFLFRYVHGGDKTNISMWELFEKPVVNTISHVEIGGKVIEVKGTGEYNGPWPHVDYPEDWMGQHSKSHGVGVNYGGNTQGGYGATGRGGTYGGANTYANGAYGAVGANRGGAHTQHPGAYGGAAHYDSEDAEALYYGHAPTRHRHTARPQVVELDDVKKNEASGTEKVSQEGQEIVVRKVVDTPTSSVEIVSTGFISPWAMEQVEELVQNLSESGYDHFMLQVLNKLAVAMG